MSTDTKTISDPKNAPEFRIPPGTRSRIRTTWRILNSPRRLFEDCLKRYGDPFLINALNGPVVVTGREDLVNAIFQADPSHFEIFGGASIIPVLGRGSMIMMDGDRHRRERKLIAPMFHGKRMRAYGDAMQQVAEESISEFTAGTQFNAIDLSTKISLRVIVRTLIGADRPDAFTLIEDLTRRVLERTSPILFFSSWTHFPFFGLSPMDRFQSARDELRTVLEGELKQRGDSIHQRDDILSVMACATYENGDPIQRDHLHDEMGTMLFAGHETTAIALGWAMYHLHQNPQWLRQLRSEIAGAGDRSSATLVELPLLKAIIQETLRLNPIVTEVLRKLRKPLVLGDYHLPAGCGVAPAAAIAHFNPETFPNPDAFDPKRFIDRQYSPSQYMPFGGGQRRCVGAAFSMYEMAIVLGTLVSEHEFELLETKPVVPRRRNITMGPSTKIKMRYVGRIDQTVPA